MALHHTAQQREGTGCRAGCHRKRNTLHSGRRQSPDERPGLTPGARPDRRESGTHRRRVWRMLDLGCATGPHRWTPVDSNRRLFSSRGSTRRTRTRYCRRKENQPALDYGADCRPTSRVILLRSGACVCRFSFAAPTRPRFWRLAAAGWCWARCCPRLHTRAGWVSGRVREYPSTETGQS